MDSITGEKYDRFVAHSKQLRVGLYARVSTTDQQCEQQISALTDYAVGHGWALAGVFADEGVSGTKDSRPALNRIMQAARQRQLDAILCWKLDRWGRSNVHVINSIQELTSHGVRFICTTQNIDTGDNSAMGKAFLGLLAVFAEFEREMIVERTLAGLARVRKHGSKSGKAIGRPKLVMDRVRIQELRDKGLGVRAIAKAVGGSASTVARLLTDA